jgi:hypothetical protein
LSAENGEQGSDADLAALDEVRNPLEDVGYLGPI